MGSWVGTRRGRRGGSSRLAANYLATAAGTGASPHDCSGHYPGAAPSNLSSWPEGATAGTSNTIPVQGYLVLWWPSHPALLRRKSAVNLHFCRQWAQCPVALWEPPRAARQTVRLLRGSGHVVLPRFGHEEFICVFLPGMV